MEQNNKESNITKLKKTAEQKIKSKILKIKLTIRLTKLKRKTLKTKKLTKLQNKGTAIQSIKLGLILEYLNNWKRLILKFKTSLKKMERTYPLIPKIGSKK